MGEIYLRIALVISIPHHREVLQKIAAEELENYRFWKNYTIRDIPPDRLQICVSYLLLWVLGFTFTLKFLASRHARGGSKAILKAIPDAETILRSDEAHKKQISELADLLDEDRFHYVGAMVLGLNDALVEFVGTLAGLTFALQNSKLIMITGIVAGVSASLSMAVSEYLSQRSEERPEKKLKPVKAGIYTGASYMMTVALLILPFSILNNPYLALPATLATAFVIVLGFTFYMSVAKSLDFWTRFIEMAMLSAGVAILSFVIGFGARLILHVTV